MRLWRFLAMIAILAVVAGATVLVDAALDRGDGGDQIVGPPDGTVAPGTGASTSTTTPPPSTGPGAGQASVTGTLTALHLEGAVVDPREIPAPLTIVSDRGFGNGGEITGVTVDGRAASIVWDGGRPFVLSAGGSLVLEALRVDLTPEGLRLALADSVQAFTPGSYQLDTPVAVGTTGVAGARDSVAFTATEASRFAATGDAALFLAPIGPRHLTGPGSVHLEGALTVTDASGSRAATVVDLAAGPYDLTLVPAPGGGWTITALLQGEVTAA